MDHCRSQDRILCPCPQKGQALIRALEPHQLEVHRYLSSYGYLWVRLCLLLYRKVLGNTAILRLLLYKLLRHKHTLVFIDLEKAFDTVDPDILLKKMQKYRVSGIELAWFTSYLQDRRQFCKVNCVPSLVEEMHCGVAQGSCLGPLLCIVYINDIPVCLESCQMTMYDAEYQPLLCC